MNTITKKRSLRLLCAALTAALVFTAWAAGPPVRDAQGGSARYVGAQGESADGAQVGGSPADYVYADSSGTYTTPNGTAVSYDIKTGDYGYGVYVTGFNDSGSSPSGPAVLPKQISSVNVVSIAASYPNIPTEGVDWSACSELLSFYLWGFGKPLPAFDLSKAPKLKNLYIVPSYTYRDTASLIALDLTKAPNLETLNLTYNTKLTLLNFSKTAKLKSLTLDETGVTSLDLRGCPNLVKLQDFRSTPATGALAALDISKCAALEEINVKSNVLTSFDFTGNPNLKTVTLTGNKIHPKNIKPSLAAFVQRFGFDPLFSIDQETDLGPTAGQSLLAGYWEAYWSIYKDKYAPSKGLYWYYERFWLDNDGTLVYQSQSDNPADEHSYVRVGTWTVEKSGNAENIVFLDANGKVMSLVYYKGNATLATSVTRRSAVIDSGFTTSAYDSGSSTHDYLTIGAMSVRFTRDDTALFKTGYTAGSGAPTAAPTHTVTFNANGGKAVASRNVRQSATVGSLPTTTRSGYTFLGWYTAATGGEKIAAATRIVRNTTFYAHWKNNATGKTSDEENATSSDFANAGAKLSVTEPTWTGKTISKFTVYSGIAKLKQGTDYKVEVISGSTKKIGVVKIKITGIGKYTGSKIATIKILPKKATKLKLKAGTKSIKATWKKVSKAQQVTGYIVQYKLKTAKKWKSKTVKVSYKGKTTASYTIKKLKKGKTYQVRVVTYKKIKSGTSKGTYKSLPTAVKSKKVTK